jgi:hypothetical protein
VFAVPAGNSIPTNTNIYGYTNSNWAGPHVKEYHSTSRFIFFLTNGPISWITKKQATVALLSTKAEYITELLTIQELLWFQQLFNELTIKQSQPIILFADNEGAINLSKNPELHARTKHIHI